MVSLEVSDEVCKAVDAFACLAASFTGVDAAIRAGEKEGTDVASSDRHRT